MMGRITVFYDGTCGFCSKTIGYYKKIAPRGIFSWRDVHASTDELAKEGVDLVEARKLLHAKDETGSFHVGVDAFILIWSRLKRWHLLARFVSCPGIHFIGNALYRAFASWRFKRWKHCQLAAKQKDN